MVIQGYCIKNIALISEKLKEITWLEKVDWWNGRQYPDLGMLEIYSDLCYKILDEMRSNDVKYQKIHACLVLIKKALLLIFKLRFIIINKNFSIQGFHN